MQHSTTTSGPLPHRLVKIYYLHSSKRNRSNYYNYYLNFAFFCTIHCEVLRDRPLFHLYLRLEWKFSLSAPYSQVSATQSTFSNGTRLTPSLDGVDIWTLITRLQKLWQASISQISSFKKVSLRVGLSSFP